MGEVYRARDERLGRDVAIKLLPEDVTLDRDRLKRFEKEARAVSSLNHPNIVTIYTVEEIGPSSFIVMELIEGKTLREVLEGGPVPVRKLLGIAAQIAEGLARAHASGIVHRDIKPENVMVTRDGHVKILDFGLAKLTRPADDEGQPVQGPTVSHMTMPGAVMGTVGYMSPEQASGRPVDFRSDQFSLGSLVYEMATGKPPFKRETAAQTLAAIIQEEPEPIAASNPRVPAPARWIAERCLAKEPRLRYASTEDLARELATVRDRLGEVSSADLTAPALKPSWLRRPKLAAWAAAVMLVAGVAAILLLRHPAEGPPLRRHAVLVPPAGTEFDTESPPAVSPDGQRMVFVAGNQLFLREFAEADAHALPETEGAGRPFWSPDNRTVGFFVQEQQRGEKLKRIGISDTAPVVICSFNDTAGGSWGADGTILFGTGNGPLYRVSAGGGQPRAVTRLDATRGEIMQIYPLFLPDGRRFLFVARLRDGSAVLEAGSLDAPSTKFLGKVESEVVAYAAPGYLLSGTAEHTLVAEPFDVDGLRLLGGRTLVAEQVSSPGRFSYLPNFSVSRTGVLAYLARVPPAPVRFRWLDRSGRTLESFGDANQYRSVALSPDGTRLAVEVPDPRTDTPDLWLYDLARGATTRLTSGSGYNPVWSPDGRQVALNSHRKGHHDIYLKSASGIAPETPLLESDNLKLVNDWSPDGRFILYTNGIPDGTHHLWALPMTGDRKPFPVTQSAFSEIAGRFSPDGRLIAYVSDESGRDEVYVQTFPQAVERLQVSSGGGSPPEWRRDGKELFYLSPDRQLMSVAIETRPVFKTAAPRPLFRIGPDFWIDDVAPDGQRFLARVSEGEATRSLIHLVFNWLPEGKR
jgi:Tol biopolymer transport system component